MAGYYRKIGGKNYDRELLELAEKLTAGAGDGRISLADARQILEAVRDADAYTDIEKRTIHYIRDHFKFTKESDKWFRKEIRSWAAKRGVRKKAGSTPKKQTGPRRSGSAKTPADDSRPFTPSDYTAPSTSASGAQTEGPSRLTRAVAVVMLLGLLALLIWWFFLRSDIRTRTAGAPSSQKEMARPPQKSASEADAKTGHKASAPSPSDSTTTRPALGKPLATVSFGLQRVGLPLPARRSLDRVAEQSKQKPGRILIIGHTCDRGTPAYNEQLGRKRSLAVQAYLQTRGVAADRMQVQSKGETTPLVPNTNEASRRRNRRVEVFLTNQVGP